MITKSKTQITADAIIEVYCFTGMKGCRNFFVNCPVGQTINTLVGGAKPVARFVVRYKRRPRPLDSLERMRYKNLLFISEAVKNE